MSAYVTKLRAIKRSNSVARPSGRPRNVTRTAHSNRPAVTSRTSGSHVCRSTGDAALAGSMRSLYGACHSSRPAVTSRPSGSHVCRSTGCAARSCGDPSGTAGSLMTSGACYFTGCLMSRSTGDAARTSRTFVASGSCSDTSGSPCTFLSRSS